MSGFLGTFVGPRRPAELRVTLAGLAFVIVALGLGAAVIQPGLMRIVLLLALLPAVIGLGLWSPTGLMYTLAVWLVSLGLVRRLIDTTATATHGGFGDPLLLVGPAVMLVLTAVAAKKGAFRDRTRLANAVLVLNVLAVVEVVNPLQGSLLVGAAGILFLLVPMLAFWVGRALVGDRTLCRLFVLLAALGLPVAIYGLFQQFWGLPSWDAAWVQSVGSNYVSLSVNGIIRAFGSFSAASEYATYLGIGIVICAAGFVRKSVAPICLALGALFAFALFLESSRGVLVLEVLGLVVMWAARRHIRPRRAVILGLVGLIALFALAHSASGPSTTVTGSAALVQHQVAGLANPLDAKDSTLTAHLGEMVTGLRLTLLDPFGHGTGSVSLAAANFGSGSAGTEVDPSNFGVALGLPGLIAYLIVAGAGLAAAYRLAARRGRWWTLAALGLLVVTFLQWSSGGQYAVAWLPWLVLGWVDRSELEHAQAEEGLVPATESVPTGLAGRATR